MDFALKCEQATVLVEKAVDVQLAVDMVTLALADKYDHAYFLSADGDFTPAVAAVCDLGKLVYPASPAQGHALWQAAGRFIRLTPDWFTDSYRDPPEKTSKGPQTSRPIESSA